MTQEKESSLGPSATGTHYAPSMRVARERIEVLAARAVEDPVLAVVLESIGGYAMVIDGHRQILASNDELLVALGLKTGDSILGLRPGEAIECVNASRGPGGCGTSYQCRNCGAVAAVLGAQVSDHPIDGQCCMSRWVQGSPRLVDFRVRVSPLDWGSERVYVLLFHDVTAVKWRELQSRAFLHDLANMLTGLGGWSAELVDAPSQEAAAQIVAMARRLTESLESHRLILQCESGEIKLSPRRLDVAALVTDLKNWFNGMAADKRCEFVVECEATALNLVVDAALLIRVLGNLIKNAIEASKPGSTVTLTIGSEQDRTVFALHNPGVIAPSVAKQLFKSRFTTKGPGRGIGMYTVQVLGEHLLGGRVAFESTEASGTVFRFTLPNAPSLAKA